MPIVPDSRLGKIEFYETHLAPWTDNAVAIGLTPAQMTAFADLVKNARGAYDAHQAAQEAAKAATVAFYNEVATMQADGSDLIRIIKTKAETTNNPNVYVLAQIPPPATPGPTPPPGTPANLRVELLQSGAITLTWKCPNPAGTSGTIYEIQRRLGTSPTTPFDFIGATGVRKFTDESLPLGPTSVTYRITAVRSTVRGNPGQFTLVFGVGGDGFTITTQSGQESQALSAAYNVEIPAPNGNGHATRGRMPSRV